MTRSFAFTVAAALGFGLTALTMTAEPTLAAGKSQMCTARLDSCLSKCDATKQACRDVCAGIWEDCMSYGGWSTKAPTATMGSATTTPTRPMRGVSGALGRGHMLESNP